MPVELREEADGRVLAFKLTGRLTKEDYEHFMPEVERLIKEHGMLRMLHPIATETVQVQLSGLLSPRSVYIERIDDDHANAKRLWIEMGKPALPTEREVEQLHVASQIVREPLQWNYEADTLHLEFAMPPHSIAAITVEMATAQSE